MHDLDCIKEIRHHLKAESQSLKSKAFSIVVGGLWLAYRHAIVQYRLLHSVCVMLGAGHDDIEGLSVR
jgi:hypothetical protein